MAPIRSAVVGRVYRVRKLLKTREGVAVAETANDVLVLLGDGVEAIAKEKLSEPSAPVPGADLARSTAGVVALAGRTLHASDSAKFNQLLASYVIGLAESSHEHRRLFACDALAANSTGWIEQLSLTASEKLWLTASHEASGVNVAAAMAKVLRLPPDRYPTKDLIVLRCMSAIEHDPTLVGPVLDQLSAFRLSRPIAGLLLDMLAGEFSTDDRWIAGGRAIVAAAGAIPDDLAGVPALLGAIDRASPVPASAFVLSPPARIFSVAQATRGEGSPARVTLSELATQPDALVDDAINLGILEEDLSGSPQPLRDYVLARIDPLALSDDQIRTLDFIDERARRAYELGDHAALDACQSSEVVERLRILDELRQGKWESALSSVDRFSGATRSQVRAIATAMRDATVREVPDVLLSDGTVWPILAPLLPADPAELSELAAHRPALSGFVAWRMLSDTVSRLFAWDWEGAQDEAKRCLRVAKDERTRDEALNLLACAQHQLGKDESAIAALTDAIEGAYSEGLQINVGVVAAGLDPESAALHLGKLAEEAPTLPLRTAAALRALELWHAAPDPWETDASGAEVLPAQLRTASRSLVRSDIEPSAFIRLAKTLARWDDGWFGSDQALDGSPYRGTTEASLYQALARGFPEFARTLGATLASDPDAIWLSAERDEWVGMAIAGLATDTPSMGAAFFGIELLDAKVPMEPAVKIELSALSIAAVAANIDPNEGEPKEAFFEHLVAAKGLLDQVSQDRRARAADVLDYAFSRFMRVTVVARAQGYDGAVEFYNDMVGQLRHVPSRQVNRSAVRQATDPIVAFLRDTDRLTRRFLEFSPDAEFTSMVTDFRASVNELLGAFNGVRGS